MSDWKERETGALWKQTSSSGTEYMSGTIGGQKVVVYANTYKQEGENSPDFRVYKQEDSPQGGGTKKSAPPKKTQTQAAPVDDDIPF